MSSMKNIDYRLQCTNQALTLVMDGLQPTYDDERRAFRRLLKAVYKDVYQRLNPKPEVLAHLTGLRVKKPKGHFVNPADMGNTRLTVAELRDIYGDELKVGKFTQGELNQLQENWRSFAERYGVEDPLHFIVHKKAGAARYLSAKSLFRFKVCMCKGLRGRPVARVYDAFKRLFIYTKKHKLTEAERALGKALDSYCHEIGDPASRLVTSIALERLPRSFSLELPTTEQEPKAEWTLEEEATVVKAVVSVTKASNMQELEEWHSGIKSWDSVAELTPWSRVQVYNRWQYHIVPALFGQHQVSSRLQLQLSIVLRLNELVGEGVEDWVEVDWEQVSKDVGNFGALFCYRQLMTMRWSYVKGRRTGKPLRATIYLLMDRLAAKIGVQSDPELLRKALPKLPTELKSQQLRKLQFSFSSSCLESK